MRTNFHESYAGSEIKPPSERSTGLLFAAVATDCCSIMAQQPHRAVGGARYGRDAGSESV